MQLHQLLSPVHWLLLRTYDCSQLLHVALPSDAISHFVHPTPQAENKHDISHWIIPINHVIFDMNDERFSTAYIELSGNH